MRLYLTERTPCPYLPKRMERRVYVRISRANALEDHDNLLLHGFRRFENMGYKPACPACNACIPVRVCIDNFFWSRTFRRISRKNRDVVVTEQEPHALRQHYRLFQKYLSARHPNGGMTSMTFADYSRMLVNTPVHTRLFVYRRAPCNGSEDGVSPRVSAHTDTHMDRTDCRTGGIMNNTIPLPVAETPGMSDQPVLAVALTDILSDGVSMVYTFFDPDLCAHSLGTFLILHHIHMAQRAGLPFVYLGHWVADSQKMAYKSRFLQQERFMNGRWCAAHNTFP